MGVSGGPYIVRDSSLVLELDAADRNSYVSGSSIWYDNSGNNYTGSLINNPAFSSTNLGSIAFDGTNDYSNNGYISQLYNTKTITYNVWLKWNTTSNNRIIIGNENQTGVVCFGIRQRSTNDYWISSGIGLANIISVTPNIDTTKIHMITALTDGTKAFFYINGVLLGASAYSSTFVSQTSFYVGIGVGTGNSFLEPFSGNIYNAQIYNRSLLPSEILQNYNALKSRFNL
jgi:hypothetical protein